jgi:hypothetical protein
MQPWILMFDRLRDGRPLTVLKRAPLLFHVILLITAYYNSTDSDRHLHRYYSFVAIVNAVVAPQILCAQPNQFNADFLRALILLQVYKPIQYEALHLNGISDAVEAEAASKLNHTANLLLQGLISRSAHAIALPSIPNTFARGFSPTVTIPPQLLSDLRLWFALCITDNHGSLQNCRPSNIDTADALKVTRLFASIKSQPSDVRLAALTELYSIPARSMSSASHRKLNTFDFRRFNTEYALWEEHWTPVLKEASLAGDPLAYTALFPLGNYLRVVVNSSVFGRWVADWQASSARNSGGRPKLSDQDWEFLQTAADAAEKAILHSRWNRGVFPTR